MIPSIPRQRSGFSAGTGNFLGRRRHTPLRAALAALAVASGPGVARAASYAHSTGSPGGVPVGVAVTTCTNTAAATVAMAGSPSGTCPSSSAALSTKAADVIAFVANTAYATATAVTGSATNAIVIQTAGTNAASRHTFTAQLGYVTGAAFIPFAGTAQTSTLTSTTPVQWAPDFSTWSGTVPTGSYLAVKVSASSSTAATATVWFGTSASSIARPSGNFSVTEAAAGTTAGTATATQTAGVTPSIAVSAPYTGDANGDNTLSYRYRSSGGSYGASTPIVHAASPYTFTLSGLTCGTSYDVEVTYVDGDGVAGTATQTISGVALTNCTATGAVSANGATCGQAAVSATFTGDADASGSTTFDRGPSATGPWTATACGAVGGGTSPRTCTDPIAAGTYWYRATFADDDGISGTNPVVSGSPVAVTACPLPSTTVGAVSATAAGTSLAPTLAISAAYADDANGNNTLSYRTRTPSGTGAWSGATPVTHAASPYTVNAPAACGSSYDVEVSFVDTDGVTGTNPTTISNLQTAACPTIAIGDASAGEAATTLVPGSGSVVLDAFTLQTSAGVVAPSSITVTMPSGSAPLVAQLTLEDSQACDHLTAHATISNPATDTPTFTGISGLPINSSSPTTIWVCLTPKTHAAMPPPPGSQAAVTGQITGVTAAGYQTTGSDVAGAARTIDNLSPDAPGGFTGTASGTRVSFTWTNPADGAQAVVLRWVGSARGSEVPVEGKSPDYAVGDAVGTATVACVVNAPGTSCADASVVSGTTYAYAIFSRDANGNWSVGAPSTPAAFTPAAGSATTTLVSSSDPAGARICPGATAYVDRFGFTVTGTTDSIGTITFQGLGASAPLASIEIRDDSGAALAPARTGSPFGDTYLFGSANLAAPIGTTSYRLYVTARPHDALPAGDLPIQPTVQSFGSVNAPSGSDAANGFVVDHAPPAQAAWGSAAPGAGTIRLTWTNPTDAALQQVFVLRRAASAPFTETFAGGSAIPAQGTTTAGGSQVVWSGSATSGATVTITDTTVASGTSYVYRIYAVDSCGNFNDGAPAGPYSPSGPFVAEGSTTPGAPMISIVNPQRDGVVTGTFRVQIRVYNPAAQGGIAGLTPGSLAYSLDDGATWFTSGFAPLSAHDTSTTGTLTGRTYEVQLAPAAGSYTLRAKVSNGVATDVRSNGVAITAVGAGGDGRLLVRDNSSQLCADCHAGHAHTSENTASAKGSWATTCRDCHAPHGTRNLGLVAEQITPPAVTAPTAPKTVTLYNRTGAAPDSYANGSSTGVCQVCHTQTKFYRADGTSPGGAHDTTACTSCHSHGKGLSATCVDCHGTAGRGSAPGADAKQEAAPPRVASGAAVSVADGGAHLAHVNQATWRSAPLPCSTCHPMPNTHQIPSQTDVAWSALASAGGVSVQPPSGPITAAWTAAPSCTNWCHGAGLAGGGGTNAVAPPSWTGTSAPCGSCHASPPPVDGTAENDHPQNPACASCHGGDSAQASLGPASKATHIDGTLQRPEPGCTACHGTLAGAGGTPVASTSPTAAPGYDPGVGAVGVDTRGNVDRALASVGAHDRHVDPAMMAPRSCDACHGTTPPDGDTTHANGTVAAGFTAPAGAGGVTPAPASFTPAWESSPTCTNYCHSSGKPIGLPATTAAPVWTSTTGMTCASCHGDAATLSTNAHPKHLVTYGIGCQACHAGTTENGSSIVLGGGLHLDGTNSVRFTTTDAGWSPFVAGATYDGAQYTCSSTYCHSNGADRDPSGGYASGPSVAWNSTVTCASCHGAGTTMVSQAHGAHTNQAATYGTTFGCQTCHYPTTHDGTTIASPSLHVNRSADVDGNPAGSLKYGDAGNAAPSSCTTYCHSAGSKTTGGTPPQYVSSMSWNSTTLTGCGSCHGAYSPAGYVTKAGEPNYANGGPSSLLANSHNAHVGDVTSCVNCHAGTVNATGTIANAANHLNGQADVVFSATYASITYTPRSGTSAPSCVNVSCHDNPAQSAQWGGTLAESPCSTCHMQSGAPNGDVDDFLFQNGTRAYIDTEDWARTGHGRATAFTDPGQSGNAGPNFVVDSTHEGCFYCHAPKVALFGGGEAVSHGTPTNPFRLVNSTWAAGTKNGTCLICHAAGTAAGFDPDAGGTTYAPKIASTNARVNAAHYGADHATGGKGGELCWDCHDPHGDYNYAQSRPIAFMIHDRPIRTHELADPYGWGVPQLTPTSELTAQTVDFSAAVSGSATVFDGTDYARTSAPYTGVCQVCHTTTSQQRADGTNATHMTGAQCTTCHAHNQAAATDAFKQATACDGCHAAVPGTSGKHTLHVGAATPAYGDVTAAATSGAYAYNCGKCHTTVATNHYSDDAGGTTGRPYQVDVGFDWATGATPYALGTASTDTGPTGLVFRTTSGTCSTYCHSNASPVGGTNAWAAPTWSTSATTTCTSCHQMSATTTVPDANLSHAHRVHTAANASGGSFYDCSACHDGIATGKSDYPTTAGSILDKSKHVNGGRDVAFNATQSPGSGYAQGPSYTCSSVYCHSNATPVGKTAVFQNRAWNGAGPLACTDCHGAKDAATTMSASHAKHINSGYAFGCQRCHQPTTTDGVSITNRAKHADGVKQDVAFDTLNPSGGYAGGSYTCSSLYCHSNATPTGGGTLLAGAPRWTDAAYGAGTCTQCHSNVGRDTTSVATDLSQKHGKHIAAATYAYKCDECHAATMQNDSSTVIGTPSMHVNNGKDVKFSTTFLTSTIDQSAGQYLSGGCTATYCHSGGVRTAAPFSATATSTALAWTTGSSTSCQACHGFTAASRPTIGVTTNSNFQGSPTHAAHVDNALVIGTNFVCADCHQATVATGNSPITTYSKHVNGVKDVQIGPRGSISSTEPYTGGSCSATYCHSSGEASPAYRNLAWNGGPALGCNGCHGLSNATGAPDYASGNSHAKHTANGTDATTCQNCHAATVATSGTAILTASTLHVNGARDVSILSTYDTNGPASNYDSASKTCSSVSCHGTGTPVWGGTATCTSCHGTTGAESTEVGATFWANNTAATINTNEWTYSGHGKTGGNYDVTANPPAAFPTTPTAGLSECLYCHDDGVAHKDANNPYRLRGATDANGVSAAYSTGSPNALCLDCHATTGANGVDPDGTAAAYAKKTGTTKADTAHDGAKHTLATLGGKFCWDCHDPHGDRTSTGGNIAMIRANVIAVSDGTHGYVGASGSAVAVNYTLQTATPPALGKAVETSSTANTQHVGLCQACHAATSDTLAAPTAWTKWWNRLGYDDSDGVGGAAPVSSAHNSGSTATPYCVSCHPHNSKFAGAGESSGGAACDGCHSDLYVSMTSGTHFHKLMAADAAYPTAAPTSATDTRRKCVMCHVDHDIFRPDLNASGGRGKNLRADIAVSPTAANTASYANKDFDATAASGGICVSCHTNPITRNTDATAGTVTMAVGKTDFAASAHTYTGTGTTATFAAGGTATMLGDCGKCHNDNSTKQYQSGYPQATHNSTLRSMQAPLGITSPTDPLAEKMCFRCHSQTTDTTPGGGPAKTSAGRDYFNAAPMTSQSERIFQVVTNQTTYPFGHPIGDASGLHKTSDGEGANPNNGSLSGANRHATCADCHNPHAAKPVSAAQRGTVSAFTAGTAPTMDTLTDSTKTWTANQWVGYTVKILSGTGAGSTSAIYGNTATALSVEFGTTVPAASSTYVILHTGRSNGNTPGGAEANAWGVVPNFPQPPNPPVFWNDVGAIANANDITNQYNAMLGWTRTTTPTIQGQICIKCHSAYAYGATPPNTLSGIGTTGATTTWSNSVGTTMVESDLANQFNPNNLSHHAVFARGKNQPIVSGAASYYNAAWPKFNTATVTTTACSTPPCSVTFSAAMPSTVLPGWFLFIGSNAPAQGATAWWEVVSVTSSTVLTVDRATTAGSGQASFLTAGLGNNFVPPWGPWSTLQCSDCHSSDSSTDPFGPHGSGTKWILTKAATQNFMFWNGTAVTNVSLAPADGNNLCLNCHRTDVYGDFNVITAANRTWSRQTHPMDTSQGQAFKSKPKWGPICMNCHGGARAGTIHGTNLGKGNNGAAGSYSGKRLLAGAYWSGVTRSKVGTPGSCFVKGATDSVSNCSNGSQGAFVGGANYGYDDAADP